MKETAIATNTRPLYIERKKESTTLKRKGALYRLLRHPHLKPYNRLAFMMVLLNTAIYLYLAKSISFVEHGISLKFILTMTLLNFGIGIFIRQQQVINGLFKIATSAPKSWPLHIRWALGKVYHFGGIHVGSYFSGSVWFLIFILSSLSRIGSFTIPLFVKYLGIFHLSILAMVMLVSLPKFREKFHDAFEIVARFGNWTSLLLFWTQTIALIKANPKNELFIYDLITSYEIWILSYLTFCIARPWLKLKKVSVEILTPSKHVGISNFDYGVTPFAGSSTDLSRNPFLEWHSFANIPAPNKQGFRLCISRAGDWTGRYINDRPSHIWVKGVPAAGVGNIELLFKKVVWVATGSGIGPCLPHLLDKKVPGKLVWSTRNPRETYGDELVDEILKAQPNTLIWDTTASGKPNLTELALQAYQKFKAEAVIVISNKKTTFEVNYELESRGIPSFGAIWDS